MHSTKTSFLWNPWHPTRTLFFDKVSVAAQHLRRIHTFIYSACKCAMYVLWCILVGHILYLPYICMHLKVAHTVLATHTGARFAPIQYTDLQAWSDLFWRGSFKQRIFIQRMLSHDYSHQQPEASMAPKSWDEEDTDVVRFTNSYFIC